MDKIIIKETPDQVDDLEEKEKLKVEDMVPNQTFLPDYGTHPFWVKDKRNQFQK